MKAEGLPDIHRAEQGWDGRAWPRDAFVQPPSA